MKKLRLNTIRIRLFLWFFLSALVLLLAVTGIYYSYSAKLMNERFGDIARKNVSQAADNLALLTQGYTSLSKSITANTDIQRVLSEDEPTPALRLINERTVINVLQAAFYSRDDLTGIHIVTRSGTTYSYEAAPKPHSDVFGSWWYDRILHSQGEVVWFGVKQTFSSQEQPVFSFGRRIYDLYSREAIGALLIEAKSGPILSTLANLDMGADSKSFIVSWPGAALPKSPEILAQSGPAESLPPGVERQWDAYSGYRTRIVSTAESSELIVLGNPPDLRWSVVSITPKANFQVQLEQANRFFLIVLCFLLGAALLLATLVSRSISAPILQLVREMKRVERGNLNALLDMRSFEEMNYLAANFNLMVKRIGQLIDRVKLAAASEKTAQLYALQSQVNPHFLYNTLDMIYWELDEKENGKLGNIILSLSKMFRYSSEWDRSDVTLGEELNQIEHYLYIIQARSGDRMQIRIDIPERWQQYQIPKMTLQPLIENAVVHGLSKLDRPGVIGVDLKADEKHLQIRVRDNGMGMPERRLAELREALEKVLLLEMDDFEQEEKSYRMLEQNVASGSSGAGIGLLNVQRRLALKFEHTYGLQIESEQGKGTTVTITVPKRAPQADQITVSSGGEAI